MNPEFALVGVPVVGRIKPVYVPATGANVGAGSTMVRLNDWLVVCLSFAESFTVTTKLIVPNAVGFPLRTPLADKLNPAGSFVDDQLYGGVPLNAANVWLYATPFNADGKVLPVKIVNGSGCQIVNAAEPTALLFMPVFTAIA